jgi:hypothetical protein
MKVRGLYTKKSTSIQLNTIPGCNYPMCTLLISTWFACSSS